MGTGSGAETRPAHPYAPKGPTRVVLRVNECASWAGEDGMGNCVCTDREHTGPQESPLIFLQLATSPHRSGPQLKLAGPGRPSENQVKWSSSAQLAREHQQAGWGCTWPRSHHAACSAVAVTATTLASTATSGEHRRMPPSAVVECPRLVCAAQRSLCEVPEVICPDDNASWLPVFVCWF